jgi:hypothetical protein
MSATTAERLTSSRRRVLSDPLALRTGAIIGTLALSLGLWFLRRPDQLLHPYVWVEEYQILNAYQTQGFLHAILSPYQGYFLWPTSFTVGVAAATSFLHVPQIDYWMSTGWFLATLCLILVPPSNFRLLWRVGMVMLMVLAPMNPEVYGIALYSFWWTTLWPLISLIWSKDYWWLRIPVLIIGGMSSLAGAALFVPYALLFAFTRRRRDLVGTSVLGLIFVVQAVSYIRSPRLAKVPIHPLRITLQELHNFADYALLWLRPNPDSATLAGACILLAILGIIAFSATRGGSPYTNEIIAMVAGLVVLGVLSSVSAPLVSDPILAGPRYYFLPYVALAWVLLMIAVTSELPWARVAATGLIAMSLLSLPQAFSRHEDRVSWSSQLARCQTAGGPFPVPVHYTGVLSEMWNGLLVITPQTCHRLGYG